MTERPSELERLTQDPKFVKWVLQPTVELDNYWNDKFTSNPIDKIGLKRVVELVRVLNSQSTSKSAGRDIQSVHAEEEDSISSIARKKIFWSGGVVVALALFLLSLAFFPLKFDEKIVINTKYGEIKEILLPDGSKAIMNGNSTLSYYEDWDREEERSVWLKGEGCFLVEKKHGNEGLEKFTVHLDGLDINVLGTVFNVDQRTEKVNVTLAEGKVEMIYMRQSGRNETILLPGETATLENGTLRKTKSSDVWKALEWRQRRMVFENNSLSEIASILKERYGVNLKFENREIKEYRFSGTFSNDETGLLLRAISEAFDLKIRKYKESHVLSTKALDS
ncbi:hypothetical protein FUAX_44720 (plasmid) [Fulvitalea axinellae]|uniref:FecR family protein n=1 Tax=Fulvitalea axinellae TaxID=1182444 RepID=A0AAU9DLI4_9BACT|nr:hypothetical protein FUAX_44720 [Fulvitalea axinellae]